MYFASANLFCEGWLHLQMAGIFCEKSNGEIVALIGPDQVCIEFKELMTVSVSHLRPLHVA